MTSESVDHQLDGLFEKSFFNSERSTTSMAEILGILGRRFIVIISFRNLFNKI